MKTFKDLEFEPHRIIKTYTGTKQAVMNFDNGYGVSVVFGSIFYSNGIDSYEVAITHNDELCYSTEITDDVIGYIKEDGVTEIMKRVQELKP